MLSHTHVVAQQSNLLSTYNVGSTSNYKIIDRVSMFRDKIFASISLFKNFRNLQVFVMIDNHLIPHPYMYVPIKGEEGFVCNGTKPTHVSHGT